MDITKEVNGVSAVVTVKIEKSDYESSVEKSMNDYRKKVQMPGFRRGKVPAAIVNKLYRPAATAEEVNKLLSNNLSQYFKAEQMSVLGEPMQAESQPVIEWGKQDDYVFVFDVALSPSITVKIDTSVELPFYHVNVSEETVNRQVDSYLTELGKNVPAEEISANDLVRATFVELDAEGAPKSDGISTDNVLFGLSYLKDDNIKTELVGKHIGDTLQLNPAKTFDEAEIHHMFNLPREEAAKADANFSATITEILHRQPAELNEELFTTIFGADTDVKTAADFTAAIRNQIAGSFANSSRYKFAMDARKYYINNTPMELPEELLKRWLKTGDKAMTDEQIEAEFPAFLSDLRWQLIRNQVQKTHNIEITEDETVTFAREYTRQQLRSYYGMINVSDETVARHADRLLQNDEDVRRFTNRVCDDKIFALIRESVTLKEEHLSEDEFNRLMTE
ncbi:MAG: trigger factor [Bacteroidales bacterium]|jgi:trigger factor|nr:trigger factor [Bacteroidales bacterium]